MAELRITRLDRLILALAPGWGQRRIRARAAADYFARNYEAAKLGRRTEGWRRTSTDANAANAPALRALRELSRDLRRNNGWAKRGIQAITNNTVGWGILAKAKARPNHHVGRARAALELWNDWADSTACDYDGRLNFYGLQRLAMETVAESGEVLVLRQPAESVDDLAIPMRLQVLEPDYLDSSRNGLSGKDGGQIVDGIEFDKRGRRVAYWLYTSHPGAVGMLAKVGSERIPADRVLHIFRVDRPGQVRGVPWLAPAITRIKDLDDFEDAELVKQKVAACFGAFVKDLDGGGSQVGKPGTDKDGNPLDQLEPGHIAYLRPGQDVSFATPPTTTNAEYSVRVLRYIAVTIGITYEELTGDYSNVNYSSARMARIAEWANITEWREHMLIPLFCDGVWGWAMDTLAALEGWPEVPVATWAAPPMAILEPDKEGLAYLRLVRIGAMTWGQMVRQLGYDPTEQLDEIDEFNQALDERGIVLDSDPRKMTSAGQQQAGASSAPKYDVGARVTALVDHMPGMKGMVGTVAIANAGDPPYYAVKFDDQKAMPGVHKWLTEDEVKPTSEAADTVDATDVSMDEMDDEARAARLIASIERATAKAKKFQDRLRAPPA